MTFPSENRVRAFSYLSAWAVYALFHTLSMYGIMTLPFWILLVDGVVHSVLGGVLGVFLWKVLRYGNYCSFPALQRFISIGALAVCSVILWIGVGFFFDYVLFDDVVAFQFLPTLVLRSFIGLLLYVILVILFHGKLPESEDEQPEVPLNVEIGLSSEEDEQPEIELLERIVVKSGQKIHVIPLADISYFQSYGDYVQIITDKGTFLKEQTMKYFETHLPSGQFVRIHRSYIVNVETISQIEQYAKQNQLIILKNGAKLKISAAGYKTLRGALGL